MIALTLLLPVVLMVGLVAMEHVERPLQAAAVADRLADALAGQGVDHVEQVVSEGYATALERYWRGHRRRQVLTAVARSRRAG